MMSDKQGNEDNSTEDENFAELFEAYSAGMNESLGVGEKISAEIIAIGKDSVYVDTGTKIDGAVDRSELLDENGQLPFEVGDMIDLYVISAGESEIRLSRALTGAGGLDMLEQAYRNAIPVEGRVLETCKGGFRVMVMQRRAFCPIGQIDLRYVENPEDYVGDTYPFRIVRFEENGRNIVLSRRKILEEEQREAQKEFFKTMTTGMELQGNVIKLMPYGAFVELAPGVEGMVHVSELSWSRIEKPDDVVNVGDRIQVKIIEIKDGQQGDQKRIALSVKQLSGDPWDGVAEQFKPGIKIKGTVTRCANFGAFVEIAPGIEGLVHISEMSYTKRILKPEDIIRSGEVVNVLVKEVDLDNRRISLSLREAEGDPWLEFQEKYRSGQSIEGMVEKKEKFGYFINLQPGITGLLPISKIKNSARPTDLEKLKEGDTIITVIAEISHQDRKITLSPGDAGDMADWKKYAADRSSASALGEKLKAALAASKNKHRD